MSRIEDRFKSLNGNKALVAFFTAGDPDLSASKEIFSVIEKSGADIIELGVPFSDPLADGPVIQASSHRSLKNGTSRIGLWKIGFYPVATDLLGLSILLAQPG